MSRTSFFNRLKPRKKGPQPRSREALQEKYGELCAKAGELQYRIETLKEELMQVNGELRQLNNEAYLASQQQPKGKVNEGPGPTLQDAPGREEQPQGSQEGA